MKVLRNLRMEAKQMKTKQNRLDEVKRETQIKKVTYIES